MERRRIAIVFCAALALCALVTKPHTLSWNDRSRLATIDALVSAHTFAIESSAFAAGTSDKYRYGGHTYSDKPPALALEGAGAAEVLAPFGITLARTPDRAVYLITLLTVGVWFALACAYAYAFQLLLGLGSHRAAFVACVTGVGTLALPYATVLANHVPSGGAALAGVYHLVRARAGRSGVLHALLAGAFFALAYAFDASAAVFGLAAVILLWGSAPRLWIACAVACAPVIAAQLAFNAHVSNGFGPPALNQSSWNDPASPFYRGADQSAFLFTSPLDYARYAVYLLIGDKGLISYTPLTLVCAYGLVRMWRGPAPQPRLAAALLVTSVAYFALMVAFTNDYGALNYGERRYVDLFFVLCVALGPALAAMPSGLPSVAARIAVVASVAIAALGVVAPFGEVSGVPGYAFAPAEFGRLAHRAPFQASIDVVVLAVMILLVLRFWSSAAAPTRGTGPPVP
jgi:hypothetical protein